MATASFQRMTRWVREPVYFAALLFASFWLFLSQTLPVWHEDVSVYPAPATPILASTPPDDPRPAFEHGCAEPGPPRLFTTGAPAMRPLVAACIGGRQYPVLVTSYASGIPYWVSDLFWPIHRGRVFWVRAAGLLLGLLNILVARRLVTRFADSATANAAALCLAVTPAFVVVQSMLVHFEVVPWLACAAAVDQLARCRGLGRDANARQGVPTGRWLAAAALVGIAMLANIKTVFLVGPLALLALRARVRFSAVRPLQWLGALAVITAIVAPLIAGNLIDTGGGFQGQVRERWTLLLAQLNPAYLIAEIPNAAKFWGDTLLFMALASGDTRPTLVAAMLVTIPSLLYCLFAAAAYLVRGRGALVPAACGSLLFTFMAVSGLLYVGTPKGNYGPLYAVFGIATAVTGVNAARWLAARMKLPERGTRMTVVGAMMAGLVWCLLARGTPTHFTTMSINAAAVRALGSWLVAHPEPEAQVVISTFTLTGVPEAVTGGKVASLKAMNYFENCPPWRNRGEQRPEVLDEGRRCIGLHFERLLGAFPQPLRFVLPLKAAPVEDALAAEYETLLTAAATAAGRKLDVEATFSGAGTGPLLRLVRVDAAR